MTVRRAIFQFNPRDLERLRLRLEKVLEGEFETIDVLQVLNEVLNQVVIPKVSRNISMRQNIFESELLGRMLKYRRRRVRAPGRVRKV